MAKLLRVTNLKTGLAERFDLKDHSYVIDEIPEWFEVGKVLVGIGDDRTANLYVLVDGYRVARFYKPLETDELVEWFSLGTEAEQLVARCKDIVDFNWLTERRSGRLRHVIFYELKGVPNYDV